MCGIAGSTFDRNGDAVRAMSECMVHRGPDDDGTYCDPETGVSLGARRLSIIDVEGGHQPVRNEEGSVWAVLNGEIYNHRSLRDRLRRQGHTFASATDTEVLVHLYEEYGGALVHALEGMFSFAIWDRRRRRLLLARDRFGEKPLFYASDAQRLTFASEITALRAGMPTSGEIDAEALDAYFVLGYFPGDRTVYRDVHQIPPATMLQWDIRSSATDWHRYWAAGTTRTRAGHMPQLVEEGLELLRRSVRSRLISDVPVGVFLSGGLDSTLVARLASEEVTGRLKTFTVGYDVGEVSEHSQAREIANWLGTEHHELTIASSQIAERVDRVCSALDQPIADPALIALHAVAELARSQVTVAVGGEGADELFGGYPRYRWIRRGAQIGDRLPGPIADAAAAFARRSGHPRATRFADVLDHRTVAEHNLSWVTSGRHESRLALYGPRLREAARADTALTDFRSVLAAAADADVVSKLMALDQQRYLPGDVLAKADRATMLSSLEMRTPYLSRQMAEFACEIPTAVHTSGGGKAVLREIAGVLSIPSAGRAKTAFRVPMTEWLRGPLLRLLRNQITGGPLTSDGWIDREALRTAVDQHATGVADHAGILWPILVAGLWLDRRA